MDKKIHALAHAQLLQRSGQKIKRNSFTCSFRGSFFMIQKRVPGYTTEHDGIWYFHQCTTHKPITMYVIKVFEVDYWH